MKLTKAQRRALEHLAQPGIECGGCHHKVAEVLRRRGLIEHFGYTRLTDWWVITDAGRAALSESSQ